MDELWIAALGGKEPLKPASPREWDSNYGLGCVEFVGNLEAPISMGVAAEW